MTPRTAAVLNLLAAPVAVGRPKRDNPRLALALWQHRLYRLAA